MPVPFDLSSATIVGEPARVVSLTMLVVVECRQCAGRHQMTLINLQPACCPSCGAVYELERVVWSAQEAIPKISLSASPPSRVTPA